MIFVETKRYLNKTNNKIFTSPVMPYGSKLLDWVEIPKDNNTYIWNGTEAVIKDV